ncbi:hypothetical protein BCT30_18080 [Enterovibrio norvegicus]|nr:hypothetical protein [Enterovibrio norvegicus]OEE44353.1 hypothetical protein A1OS_09630 [Enterovibrio norvegicus]PMI28797.1 hypothetical protein BCU47_20685 [Enterovibrio norvegicus]PMI36911.1 hypothetical protein BCU46_01665 [Enterovibrio norvegicus]PMN49421.1 hypothetical protein BCT30_18080 [Enterovibrio norvegicus]
MSLEASEIFVPTHYPKHTLVKRQNDHTNDVIDAIADRSLVSISGPSKSGKTVLVESAMANSSLIVVTGGGITCADDIWAKVLDQLGTPLSRTVTNSSSSSNSKNIGGRVAIGPRVANVQASTSLGDTENTSRQESRSFTRDSFNLVLDLVGSTGTVIFLDDFHYIPRNVQVIVAQQVKELVRKKIQIVYAAVPYHADDIIRANSDLQGRIYKIDLSYWSDDELMKIIDSGFEKLNFSCDLKYKNKLIKEAAGSPQLMQSLCLSLCRIMNAREQCMEPTARDITPSEHEFFKTCEKVSNTIDYDNLIERLLEGAPTRGRERKLYQLKDGSTGDVYKITLRALKQDPARMIIRYNELYTRVQNLCEESPQTTGIMQACAKISDISAKHLGFEKQSTDEDELEAVHLIEFDSEDAVISIRDPYLLYAIRWSDKI